MARAAICDPKRRAMFEPIYEIDRRTRATIEVFYADPVLAKSFGINRWLVPVALEA